MWERTPELAAFGWTLFGTMRIVDTPGERRACYPDMPTPNKMGIGPMTHLQGALFAGHSQRTPVHVPLGGN